MCCGSVPVKLIAHSSPGSTRLPPIWHATISSQPRCASAGDQVMRSKHCCNCTTALPTWAYVWGRYLAGLVRISLIPDELQGRVNSVFRLLAFGFQPFGFALTGLLIQWFQVVPAILFLSACALFLAILTSVNKHVIHAGRE